MKITLSAIRQFIDIKATPAEIAEKLTSMGVEVDQIYNEKPSFTKVVAAKIVSAAKHPSADKLSVAEVFDGKETLQIVCGAPNCKAGMVTALAQDGAILSVNGESMRIKKSKLRGLESFGMLCSAKELGLATEADGILDLPQDLKPGSDLAVLCDPVFEISLTPNLGHCMSALGIARMLSAAFDIKVHLPKFKLEESQNKGSAQIAVEIKSESCPLYSCRILENCHKAATPFEMKRQLEACGFRSIGAIVDITNYVMLMLGHPLHAFDLQKVEGHKIIVRKAGSNETFACLDGQEKTLEKDMLVIADQKKPIAIAGVMGGLNSAISDDTKSIVLESAAFEPVCVSKTARKLSLKTESASRFEKGCDIEMAPFALDYAAFLLSEITGAKICSGSIVQRLKPHKPRSIVCRSERVNRLLGTKLSRSEIGTFFAKSGLEATGKNGDFSVAIPSYRNDLQTEIDLVEEAAIIYGYNNIKQESTLCHTSRIGPAPMYTFEKKIKTALIAGGLQEIITCDLISPKMASIDEHLSFLSEAIIEVLHPKSLDQSILRPSLLPSFVEVIKHNLDHKNNNLAMFEIARTHFKQKKVVVEQTTLSMAITGLGRPWHWQKKPQEIDFFDLKGLLENLLSSLNIHDYSFGKSTRKIFHPGRQANLHIGSINIGVIGEIHPAILAKLDLGQKIFFAEINLDELFKAEKSHIHFQKITQYPSSHRDVTLTLNKKTPIAAVFEAAAKLQSPILQNFEMIDLYQDNSIGEEKKNATFRFIYQDKNKTLSFDEIEKEHAHNKLLIENSLPSK